MIDCRWMFMVKDDVNLISMSVFSKGKETEGMGKRLK